MMTKTTIAGLLTLSFAAVIPAAPAAAGDWAKEWTLQRTRSAIRDNQKSIEQTRDAVNEVREEVRDSTDRLIEALRGHSGEQSAYQDKQIEANRRIVDAAQLNDSTRLRQQFRAAAESGDNDPAPDLCLVSGLYRGTGADAEPAKGSVLTAAARADASGVDPAVREGGAALHRGITDDRERYANAMGYSDPTVDPAVILEQATLPASTPEDEAAIRRLVRNMTDPMPPRPVTSDEIRTPEGRRSAALRTIQQTRAAAGQELISMLMNMRTPVGPTEPFMPLIEDIANYNRPVGDQISELQSIDIRTLRYYAPKPEVFAERAAMSDKALLQSILDSVSIGNRIAYMQLELDSRRAAVETQILSSLANGG